MGCDMGYLEIYEEGDKLSVEFMPYPFPKFRYYKEGEKHENTDDFWIEIPKPKKLEKSDEVIIKPNMDKMKMAKRYAKVKGVKSKKKIHLLIDILNKADD